MWKGFDLHCRFEGGEGHTRRNGGASGSREWPWLASSPEMGTSVIQL